MTELTMDAQRRQQAIDSRMALIAMMENCKCSAEAAIARLQREIVELKLG